MKLESSDKRTILAVDDKLENLKVLIRYLEASGFELMVAQSGEEAFQHIERMIPDMILLDILMPGIDGFETCQRLKANEATKDIPVIFMTALTDTLDKVKGFEHGAVDYLTKPLQLEEVLARVNAHMATRESQQQLQKKNILLQQKITVFSNLIQMESSAGPIIAQSLAMRRLEEQITRLMPEQSPILITGESGTGHVLMAKKIHEHITDIYAPCIIVDCRRIEDYEAGNLLFGSKNFEGIVNKAGGFGALHLADQGTLVLMHIETLDRTSQMILSQYLREKADAENIPKINLIATTSKDLSSLAQSGLFLPEFVKQLTANVLKIPSMRKRRRDILPLAKLFLAKHYKRFDDGEYQLSRSAEHALLSGQYRHRNVDELREAVESAILLSGSHEITAEHIFTGPKSEGTKLDFNLSRFGLINRLLQSTLPFVALKAIFFVVFITIILLCLTAGNTLTGNIANQLIWGVWEPGLIILFLFVGRLWCTVCPISSAGRIAQKIGCLKMNPPKWLMQNTGWVNAALFFLIVWSEHVFHMTEYPFGTGILFLLLVIVAMFFFVLYKRETWCRYLCPLGNLGALYSVFAMVRVRANPGVCAVKCDTHECYKGSPDSQGCPVFHHPLYARDSHFCKMCFSCLRSCPHGSTNLYLRAPIQNIRYQSDLSSDLTPLALVGFFLALVLLGARTTVWLADPLMFTAAALLAVIGGIALHVTLPGLLSREQSPDPALISRVALVLFILGWGPLMAYNLQEIPLLEALHLKVAEGYSWEFYLPITNIAVLPILQVTFIFSAGMFVIILLWKIWIQSKQQTVKFNPRGWKILIGMCTLYLLIAVCLSLFFPIT
ncbi:MAG: response regulator [Desulfobacula sp.]|nr:response regulator [Desulfobacula sp.]